jgi:hypothetical protein
MRTIIILEKILLKKIREMKKIRKMKKINKIRKWENRDNDEGGYYLLDENNKF